MSLKIIADHEEELRLRMGLPAANDVDRVNKIIDGDSKLLTRLGGGIITFVAPRPEVQIEFNKFLAEPLLRDGSALIDRCLQLRRESDELRAKYFEALVQVEEVLALNAILEKEEPLYNISSELDLEEAQDSDKSSDGFEEAGTNMGRAVTMIDTRRTDVLQNLSEAAFGALASNPSLRDVGAVPALGIQGGPARDYALHSARLTANLDYDLTRNSMYAQAIVHNFQAVGADSRAARLRKAGNQKARQAELQVERNNVSRFVAARRALALSQPGGALCFGEQIEAIVRRFDIDSSDAYVRLKAAADGLKLLYEYSLSFPNPAEGNLNLDAVAEWCQLTNTWLAAFQDRQQVSTRSISLKSLDEAEFEGGKEAGIWKFKLGKNNFPDRKMIRLRSIAVQVDSRAGAGSWNVSITVPTTGRYTGLTQQIELDQGHVGTVYLGRVGERRFAVLPESQAISLIQNVSPISESPWEITVQGSTVGVATTDINDVDMHFAVAFL